MASKDIDDIAAVLNDGIATVAANVIDAVLSDGITTVASEGIDGIATVAANGRPSDIRQKGYVVIVLA